MQKEIWLAWLSRTDNTDSFLDCLAIILIKKSFEEISFSNPRSFRQEQRAPAGPFFCSCEGIHFLGHTVAHLLKARTVQSETAVAK
jgi:hypothetical protein